MSAVHRELDDGFHAWLEAEVEAGRDGDADDHDVFIRIICICDLGSCLGLIACGRLAIGNVAVSGISCPNLRALRILAVLAGTSTICASCIRRIGVAGAGSCICAIDRSLVIFLDRLLDILDGTLELVAFDLVGDELAEADLRGLVGG